MRSASQQVSDQLDLRELEIFAGICEARNLSIAARRFGITQPAASHVVRRLEARLGVRLLDRSVRPVTPTTEGNRLLYRAERLLGEARQLAAEFNVSKAKSADLRVGLVESLAVPFVPHLVSSMKGAMNRLSVWPGRTAEQRQAFLERQLDVIITSDPLHDVEGVERHTIVTEPFVLLVPMRIAGTSIVEDVRRLSSAYPMVRFSGQSAIGRQIEGQLSRMQLNVPRSFEFDSSETIIGMVAADLGWAVVTPMSLLRSQHYLRQVTVARFPGPTFTRRLVLVARAGELGTLPRRIAVLARRILQDEYFPQLQRIAPWLRGGLDVSG